MDSLIGSWTPDHSKNVGTKEQLSRILGQPVEEADLFLTLQYKVSIAKNAEGKFSYTYEFPGYPALTQGPFSNSSSEPWEFSDELAKRTEQNVFNKVGDKVVEKTKIKGQNVSFEIHRYLNADGTMALQVQDDKPVLQTFVRA